MTAYFYINKQIWKLSIFSISLFLSYFPFTKKCTIDLQRSTMMSLSEMHSMVTHVHIAIVVGLITAYTKETHIRKSCTMHRYRVYLDNLYKMPNTHPINLQPTLINIIFNNIITSHKCSFEI